VERVAVSSKFQVVIARSIRERLKLRPGHLLQVFPYEDRIELIPLRPARELRGSLRGMSTELTREPDRPCRRMSL
jgi:AbrB family looped-hinge helix DNA binding protein